MPTDERHNTPHPTHQTTVGIRLAAALSLPAWLCALAGWLNFALLFFITSAVIFLFWKSE